MSIEIYKDIKGYEGLYMVSNCGNVKSLKKGCILKARYDKNGYKRVGLNKDGKKTTYTIHRLVAETFIENPFNFPSINHIDENKENNNSANLEWCTVRYNNNYGERNKKIAQSRCKPIFCVNTGKIFSSIKSASERMHLKQEGISKVCRGEIATYKGYKFEFVLFPSEMVVV